MFDATRARVGAMCVLIALRAAAAPRVAAVVPRAVVVARDMSARGAVVVVMRDCPPVAFDARETTDAPVREFESVPVVRVAVTWAVVVRAPTVRVAVDVPAMSVLCVVADVPRVAVVCVRVPAAASVFCRVADAVAVVVPRRAARAVAASSAPAPQNVTQPRHMQKSSLVPFILAVIYQ